MRSVEFKTRVLLSVLNKIVVKPCPFQAKYTNISLIQLKLSTLIIGMHGRIKI